jgi:hypothetical protein
MLVFGEFIDNAARRGESPAGDGDGVGDHVKCGVGGWDAAETVHVREHTAHMMDRHLKSMCNGKLSEKTVVTGGYKSSTWHSTEYYYWGSHSEHDDMMSKWVSKV